MVFVSVAVVLDFVSGDVILDVVALGVVFDEVDLEVKSDVVAFILGSGVEDSPSDELLLDSFLSYLFSRSEYKMRGSRGVDGDDGGDIGRNDFFRLVVVEFFVDSSMVLSSSLSVDEADGGE